MGFKSGFAAILGRPNAGKSTLVNRLVGQKVAIVSPKPQTTRNRIQGIVNRDDAQIVLIDTPGIHKPENELGRQMMEEVRQALEALDVLLLIVDASAGFGGGDRFALEMVKNAKAPAILLLNKVDAIAKERLLPLIDRYSKEHEFVEIIPISALTGDGLEIVLDTVVNRLPESPPYFPPEQYTDQPERFLAGEIVREKAIVASRQEVPYAIAVLVDSFEESAKLIRIRATLYVERDGQKGILIGKGGAMLKKIGTEARLELEELLGTKIFLGLHVKVQEDWRDRPALVRQLDWHRQLERIGEREESES
ncbi:MAG: GTPase Era [Acidobacteria bacterium]|nr:GTPase Era [Acidobacteriota bacterium]